jgi:hypothetical protein
MVNGLKLNEQKSVANGAGCLAAQLVCRFKKGPGGTYLCPPKMGQDMGQEYEYHIHIEGEEIALIRVLEPRMEVFSGSLVDFGLWLNPPQTN